MKKLILLMALVFITSAQAALDARDFKTTVGLILQKKEFKTVCSGVLIKPDVVLTAAHCLTGLVSVRVINNYQITKLEYVGVRGRKFWGTKWVQHPEYNGVEPGSVDIGLIFLNRKFNTRNEYNEISQDIFTDMGLSETLYRIGYGKRGSSNIRNVFEVTYKKLFGDYVIVNDYMSKGGDSGGPLYSFVNSELKVIGIHCGRMVDDDKKPIGESYLLLLSENIQDWIAQTLSDAQSLPIH